MPTLLIVAGAGMAALLDFATGTLIVTLLGAGNVPWWYLLIGGALALLPDIVRFPMKLIWPRISAYRGEHESPDHWPMLMLPTCTLVALALSGPFWATTTLLCLLWHYTHDMEIRRWDTGGIAFYAPLVRDLYFSWWEGFYPREKSMIFSPAADTKTWIARTWLTPTPHSKTELAASAAILPLAAYLAVSLKVAAVLFILICLGAPIVWLAVGLYCAPRLRV